jgi:predicted nucleic acid-binding protein
VTADRGFGFDCVVDASVGIKLFLAEPLSDRADALFTHLGDDPPARLYVPDLFFIECTNILWKYVQRFAYDVSSARQNLAELAGLPVQVISTLLLAESALDLAITYGSSAYDAAYVALANDLSLPLVTADEALVRRFDGTVLDVRHLGNWPSCCHSATG